MPSPLAADILLPMTRVAILRLMKAYVLSGTVYVVVQCHNWERYSFATEAE